MSDEIWDYDAIVAHQQAQAGLGDAPTIEFEPIKVGIGLGLPWWRASLFAIGVRW